MFPRLVKLRAHFGFVLCSVGFVLGMLSFAATPPPQQTKRLAANSTINRRVANERLGSINGEKANQSLASSQAAAGWSLVASPNNSSLLDNQLTGVTCASASECWAIGSNGYPSQGFIEQWNGTSWALVSSPSSDTQDYSLASVTCASTSECWAVGYYDNGQASVAQTLIEQWNGTSWSIVTSANTSATQSNYLNAVTCASASDCWAIGDYVTSQGDSLTLAEHWNGASWSIVPSPSPNTFENSLNGVTCTSSANCWAVGSYNFGNQTLVEQWNGTSWSVVISPNGSTTMPNYLNAVTCASASQCWAVGYYVNSDDVNQTLIEEWNGSAWSIVTSPNASTDNNSLNSVTCVSASQCWAVGNYVDPNNPFGDPETLIEQWNGISWAIVASPNSINPNNLYGVTCVTGSECWAVGNSTNYTNEYDDYYGYAQTLIEQWDGTSWTIVTSPNTAGSNSLDGVTCISASQCWAVGYSEGFSSSTRTLIEQWNGISWTIVASPNTDANTENLLFGVACTSASDCWAVGYCDSLSSGFQTLFQHWDGTSWTITGPANQNGLLTSVTCTSASQCWAVGYYNNGHRQTLVEQWDGNAWTIVSSPNTSSTQTNYLNAVTCASASGCWAVGYYNNGTADQTLIEQWNGTSWTIVSSPSSSATQKNHLEGVACASSSDCWAVGYYVNGSGFQQPLIEQWNGGSWTTAASPNVSATQNNYFYGVTCASSSDCWAVGNYFNGSNNQTFIGQWTGSSWSTVASPSTTATQDNQLTGVTCVSPSQCWAVGNYTNDSGYAQTLIEEYTASLLQITSVSGPTNGHFTIMGQSPPSIPINIQVSPDLVTPFTTFATVMSDANGFFEFDDGSAGMVSQRFYDASYQ